MARFANLESAEDQLAQAGLRGPTVQALLDEARDALMFTRTLRDDVAVPIGISKLGGAPDLPAGMAWPHRGAYGNAPAMIARMETIHGPTGYVPNAELLAFYTAHWSAAAPLSFLGQIDLEAMALVTPFEAGIARKGHLLVFADIASLSSGAHAMDEGWLSVIHAAPSPLTRTEPPAELSEVQATFARLQYRLPGPPQRQSEVLEGVAITSLPQRPNTQPAPVLDALRALDLADLMPLMGSSGPGEPVLFSDQLGGHPVPIQNDVFQDLFTAAQPVLRPVTLAEQSGRWDPQRWHHLLSLGGESYLSDFPSSWGDGDLYIAHRPDPARLHGLGQVWAIGQQT